MLGLSLARDPSRPLRVLAVGAHADDIEIGCGGTILHLADGGFPLHVTWVVLAAAGVREREAVSSAAAFLKDIEQITLALRAFAQSVRGREGIAAGAGSQPARPPLVHP